LQRVATDGVRLDAAHLLYLSTLGGADALGLGHEIGSLCPGKSADFVLFRAPGGSVLDMVVEQASTPEEVLSALFTLGGAESVREVRVAGEVVYLADGVSSSLGHCW
jgi:guanine deaminase